MSPARILGWSLTAIAGSVAAVFVMGALMFAVSLVESLAR